MCLYSSLSLYILLKGRQLKQYKYAGIVLSYETHSASLIFLLHRTTEGKVTDSCYLADVRGL